MDKDEDIVMLITLMDEINESLMGIRGSLADIAWTHRDMRRFREGVESAKESLLKEKDKWEAM